MDVIRVRERNGDNAEFDRLPSLFTINLYRSNNKMMVNENSFKRFVESDLPILLGKLDQEEDLIYSTSRKLLLKCKNTLQSPKLPINL